jgi:hypothetical protein
MFLVGEKLRMLSSKKYYLCYGGANIAGAFCHDLEPEICYGTRNQALSVAVDMAAEAVESYGVDEESDFEPEYNDYAVRVVSAGELTNWGIWDKFKTEVAYNGHKWEDVVKEYGLVEPD